MARWLRRAAAITVGWVGAATAQQPLTPAGLANTGTAPVPAATRPAPAPPPTLDEPVTLVIRTTGQPERRLKVLKRSSYENGETLVDVQDTMSGERFTLPGRVADRLPRFTADGTTTAPAPPPVERHTQAIPSAPPPLHPVVRAPQPPPPVGVPAATVPAVPKSADTIWKPVLPDTAPPQPRIQPLQPPTPTVLPSPAFHPVPVSPGPAPVPTPTPNAPGDRWKPIPPPTPSPTPAPTAPDGIVVRGQMPSTDLPPKRPVVRAGWTTGAARVSAPDAARAAEWTLTVPVVAVERPNPEAWLAEVVRREMRPLVEELTTALRPSVRANAAAGLAEMRYAARPEVKELLAKTAMSDPADIVRTTCVRALTRLGYDGAKYVEFLGVTVWGRHSGDALRFAAADALRQLRPRN